MSVTSDLALKAVSLFWKLSKVKGVKELHLFFHIFSSSFNKLLLFYKSKFPMMADFFIRSIKQW